MAYTPSQGDRENLNFSLGLNCTEVQCKMNWIFNDRLLLFCPESLEGEVMEKSTHPTAVMLTSTVNLLKTLSLSSGIHADVMQTEATRTLCGLLRMLVESGANDQTGNFILCLQYGVFCRKMNNLIFQ